MQANFFNVNAKVMAKEGSNEVLSLENYNTEVLD